MVEMIIENFEDLPKYKKDLVYKLLKKLNIDWKIN